LDLNALIQNLRAVLLKAGAVELPAVPAVLPFPWAHPEILSRVFLPGEGNWFCFPVIAAEDDCQTPPGSCSAGFIWLKKPFNPVLITRLQEIIPAAVGSEGWPAKSFQIRGQAFPATPLLEAGCSWSLLCRGCICGEIRVLSGFGGELLPDPVGFVSLSLPTLTNIANGDVSAASLQWSKDFRVEDILSWKPSFREGGFGGAFSEDLLRKKSEFIEAALDRAVVKKSAAEILQGIIDGGLLCKVVEAMGMEQSPLGRETVSAFRTRLKNCFPLLARAAQTAVGASKNLKDGVLR